MRPQVGKNSVKDTKEEEEEFQQTRQHQKEVSFWLYKLARSVQRKRTLSLLIYSIICLKSVDVRKRQVAILVRSPREMSQTDRILPRYILSRVRVSVRPRIFFISQTRPHVVYFQVVHGSALRPDKQLNWKLQNRLSWVASR